MKDACTIFEKNQPADFVLLTSDGVPLHVHKWILSEVSSVFRDMFSLRLSTSPHAGSESKELPSAHIEESSETMIMLLKFAYPQFNSGNPGCWFPDWPNKSYSCDRSQVSKSLW